jgi:tryptophan synthase alpha chain
MRNRIEVLFEKRKKNILSVFYTAGFPAFGEAPEIAEHLQAAGVDMIEIGIPFSDPVADGTVIQDSNAVALRNGMTVKNLLEQVRLIRQRVQVPILLMGYVNPIMQYGFDKFCADFSAAGVDGVILPDLPLEVYEREYRSTLMEYNLKNIFLISPTTSAVRVKAIDDATDGFIYAVSSSSTTGARKDFDSGQESYFRRLNEMKLKNPFLIGFGVSTHKTFTKACEFGAGAIVGSAFVSLLASSNDRKKDIHDFVIKLRG